MDPLQTPSATPRQAEYFANRLVKNEKALRKWARKNDVHALRLYDKDIPEIPLAVDFYEDESSRALVISLYERPYEKPESEESLWLGSMARAAGLCLAVEEDKIFLKTRKPMKGLDQYEKKTGLAFQMRIRESGLFFSLNLSEYLDTGLFLDHRPARGAIREAARGARVLNLFSYTGSFSVYAAAGGAELVTSVDLSNTYLAWASRNFSLNGLESSVHSAIKADAARFLKEAAELKTRWDIIIADPPTFSNSTMAARDFDVNRDWPALMEACSSVLAPEGTILFSTNSRQLRWNPSLVTLPWKDVTETSIPPDFRNKRIHSCWILGNIDKIGF
jgi:23S rRNA (cytosine1962-C5)-methyltransferase